MINCYFFSIKFWVICCAVTVTEIGLCTNKVNTTFRGFLSQNFNLETVEEVPSFEDYLLNALIPSSHHLLLGCTGLWSGTLGPGLAVSVDSPSPRALLWPLLSSLCSKLVSLLPGQYCQMLLLPSWALLRLPVNTDNVSYYQPRSSWAIWSSEIIVYVLPRKSLLL